MFNKWELKKKEKEKKKVKIQLGTKIKHALILVFQKGTELA